MSEQFSLQGTEIGGSAFPIGSRRVAIFRLSTLFTASLAVLVLHYLALWKLTNWLVALLLLAGTWVLVLCHRWMFPWGLARWVDFLLKDSAYGVVTGDGFKYQSMLRSRCVPWSSAARIEYAPRNGDRIDVFKVGKFTFSRVRPIHFGPAACNSKAIQGIERILNQQGAPGKLVITDSEPEKFFHL